MLDDHYALANAQRDPLAACLESAALMADAQAALLDLPLPEQSEYLTRSLGMTLADARHLILWLRDRLESQRDHPCCAITIPIEQWPPTAERPGGSNDGEAAAIRIMEGKQFLGWIIFLGRNGMLHRPPLALPRYYAALVAQVSNQVQTALDLRRLQSSHAQLDTIFRFNGDGILTVDAALRITSCNPALADLLSQDPRAIQGVFYYDVLRPEDMNGEPLGLARCPLVEAFATEGPVIAREMIIRSRDGERIPVAVTTSAARSPEGLPVSGVMSVRDVSRRRENEMLSSTIVSVVSHELQTPIAIIKGYASTLRRTDVVWQGDALSRRLVAIEEEADRLSHMVSNLLYASRINAGKLMMEPQPNDVVDLLQSVVRRFRMRGIPQQIELDLADTLPEIVLDRERITEVVANLIDNASKYSLSGTTIRVAARTEGENLVISVTDRGEGIPLREQQRVFDRFQRLDNGLARKTNGAGLGLYICQAIVKAHGGKIGVESEIGHGSTFFFALPLTAESVARIVHLDAG